MNQETNTFNRKIHFWGRVTIAAAFLFSLSIPLYLTVIKGYVPAASDIITGLVSIAGFVGIVWFVEPVSYFPILGPAGTYMSFLTGNIGNMRLPVIGAVQNALDLEAGTKKAEVAGIFALISSIVVNLLILGLVVIAGQIIVSVMPKSLMNSFNYALPGILGAMLVMFAKKMNIAHTISVLVIGTLVAVLIRFSPAFLPATVVQLISVGDVGVAAIFGIIFSIIMAKRDGTSEESGE